MVEPLRPARGGFLRPFGCGWFIREFLMGHGPNGSPKIDPSVGAPQSDICYHYKKALLKAIAVDRATRQEEKQAKREKRLISPDKIERLTTRYLLQTSYKSSGCRYHSFVVYFSNLQRLGWVEESGKVERSAFQDNYPREVILVSSFASLRQAELPLKLLGQTPLLPSMGSGVC